MGHTPAMRAELIGLLELSDYLDDHAIPTPADHGATAGDLVSTPELEQAIREHRDSIRVAQTQLWGMVMAACPGPHRPVQHRDRRPPWCEVCRRTADGVRVDVAAEAKA